MHQFLEAGLLHKLQVLRCVEEQLAAFLPFGIACALVGYGVTSYLNKKQGACNPSVKKSEAKVVHSVDIEDLGDQTAFCRCWRSGKFPYCDGTHNKYNESCGDNVGPVIVKKKKK